MHDLKRFLDDCCVTDWRSELPVEDLDAAYRRWCTDHNERPLNRGSFADVLFRVGYVRAKRDKGWIWGGVKLARMA